ncbi:phage holin family protein [Candidatus Saccharibacteria bacterium]|nr:MAG: phage holin family protein [Candidatus Saccharibacteria bacterium]
MTAINNKQGFLYSYMLRWFVCSLGLWVAAGLLQGSVNYQNRISVVVGAGALLALINAFLKPLLVLLSLPAILLTLGLFMLVINGATVYLASKLYSPLQIDSFGVAILTGVIIGLINYLVSAILDKPST